MGDELEHFIYSLNVAKMFEASIFMNGGLISGSTKVKHVGAAQYPDIATLLGIHPVPFSFVSKYSPQYKLELNFSQAIYFKHAILNGSAQLLCNTTIVSNIYSCKGWCPLMQSEFDWINNVSPVLRNSGAKSTCIAFGRG